MSDVSPLAGLAAEERRRIRAEYKRRRREVESSRYSPWNPAEMLFRSERKRVAAEMLHEAEVFPRPGDRCLEIGFGSLGLLGDLISWGVRSRDLCGIDLDSDRVAQGREVLPSADLRVGDAVCLPWESNSVRLVVMSTVVSSILDARVRRMVAHEAARVLGPGGAVLWYDFAVNNPSNPHVRRVGRKELKQLFPTLRGKIRSVTLAPPLARLVARRSWLLATVLSSIPLLRTHLLAVLLDPSVAETKRTMALRGRR